MWSYNANDLNVDTASGLLNMVRLLVGDTNDADQQLQDEEVVLALSQNGDDPYKTSAWCCRIIASKYSRLVDTTLDSAISARYSQRYKTYLALSAQLEVLGKKTSGKSLGISAGGISKTAMDSANKEPDRVLPAFDLNQFDNPGAGVKYIPDYQ